MKTIKLTVVQYKELLMSSTVCNLMDAYLRHKFGNDYVKFMEETSAEWIEKARARALEAQTQKDAPKPSDDQAAQEES